MEFGIKEILIWIVVGSIAVWLADLVVKGISVGLLGKILVGMAGGLLAGLVLTLIGIDLGTSFFKDILIAFVGAVILLFILRLVKGKK
jgi:uncharacterized membrane protein YeaQ/YmgE (transglycosylase-associated protein family)